MRQLIEETLGKITQAGNLRRIPAADLTSGVDFSSNDYLGLAARTDLAEAFFADFVPSGAAMSASASRLLSARQNAFTAFERVLSDAYAGRATLLFNSGYHANTGLVSAFAGTGAYVLADKLVHASIIDGIKLSGLPFARFRHNDMTHLDALAAKAYADGHRLIIVAESVYSMDGDRADVEGLVAVKRRYPGSLLYLDEAHAVGVEGPAGLGLAMGSQVFDEVDIVVGTLGKALASTGAYAIMDEALRSFMVNRARSLIFSTAQPPLTVEWSRYMFETAMAMDSERDRLRRLGAELAQGVASVSGVQAYTPSHIQALICGSPERAVGMSAALREDGLIVLPIRTPTVPPGTDRLRISLSASLSISDIQKLTNSLSKIIDNGQQK